jgi:hypothetical protein
MTCAWHELQASVRQSAGEPAAGIDGNQGVLRVGEQEHRPLDGRDGALQFAQFAYQGALLGQERAPERGVLAARFAPDLPVDVLVRARRAAAPPAYLGQPGTGDPWRQPPRHQRAQRPHQRCGQQPVPAVHASGADAGEQDHCLHPVRRQARHGQCHSAAVGVPHQHRSLDAARVQVIEHGLRVHSEPAGPKPAGAVSRPVSRDGMELCRQPPGHLQPVGGRARLPVQQHQLVSTRLGWHIDGSGVSGQEEVFRGRRPRQVHLRVRLTPRRRWPGGSAGRHGWG